MRPIIYLSMPSRDLRAAKGVLGDLWHMFPDADWIAPWITIIEALGDASMRARGLECDCEVIRRCDGVLLVGEPTEGMELERAAAHTGDVPFARVDGLDDEDDRRWIRALIDVATDKAKEKRR